MLETVLGIASSAGLGSIVGVVGGWLTKRENRKADAQRQAHDLALANIDLQQDRMAQDHALALADKGMESSQLEGQIAIDVASAEGSIAIDKIEAEAFASSVAIQTKMTGICRWYSIPHATCHNNIPAHSNYILHVFNSRNSGWTNIHTCF